MYPKKLIIEITFRKNNTEKQILIKYNFIFYYFVFLLIIYLYSKSNIISIHINIFTDVMLNGSINISQCASIVFCKEFLHWSNLTTSYHQRIPLQANNVVQLFSSAIARELCHLIHIKNIYCTSLRALSTEDKQIIIYNEKKLPKLSTKYGYNSIIYLYSDWGQVFAHFLHDCLPQLLFYSKELVDKSMIMISFNVDFAQQYLQLFNISKNQILFDKSSWYFTNNLYLCISIEPHNGFNMYSFPKIVKLLRKELNISSINSVRFVFINRKKGEKRYIQNFQNFYLVAKKQFPVKWDIDILNYSNLTKIAQQFASIKLLVTPSGSHTNYLIFMQRNFSCGICLIQSEWIDLPNFISAFNNQIWMNGFCNTWRHHDRKPHNCNLTLGLECLSNLYYAILNHKWNNKALTTTQNAFNFEEIIKMAKLNYLEIRLLSMKNNTIHYPLICNGWN